MNLKKKHADFFDKYGPTAQAILRELLTKYEQLGASQFVMPDVLQVPPISEHGSIQEIAQLFGGPALLRQAVIEMQVMLYA